MFEGVVDVSAGLTNPTRILYSKVAKKATFLDDFLSRRLQLKSLEERRIELEDKKLGVTRVYSSFNASGKLYLKKIRTVAESKKQSKIIKYPLVRIIIYWTVYLLYKCLETNPHWDFLVLIPRLILTSILYIKKLRFIKPSSN